MVTPAALQASNALCWAGAVSRTLPAALWGQVNVMRCTSLLMLLSMLCWKALPDSTACHSWRLLFASLPVLYLQCMQCSG